MLDDAVAVVVTQHNGDETLFGVLLRGVIGDVALFFEDARDFDLQFDDGMVTSTFFALLALRMPVRKSAMGSVCIFFLYSISRLVEVRFFGYVQVNEQFVCSSRNPFGVSTSVLVKGRNRLTMRQFPRFQALTCSLRTSFYQELLVTPGMRPRCAMPRKQMRQTPKARI